MNAPHVLIVAGSDSSGGAGIARDIETVGAFGMRTCLAVTAVTVQTHDAVRTVETMPPLLVEEQMRAALEANPVAAIKIGMLAAAETVEAVAAVLRDHPHIPTVLDPVLAASSGRALLVPDAIARLKRVLMPLPALVTPNLHELALLAGEETAADKDNTIRQGEQLLLAGCQALLLKGGHAAGDEATDILLRPGAAVHRFSLPKLTVEMRGTGCILSSAVASLLARGERLENSVAKAKRFLHHSMSRTGK
ncbi:hydroxymethylpyrimidine/phosphomethylpyrimidine kinase [Chelativorans sp. YIM 93263]|uniref:hydroxymethylpyrimidine/phosphomethylpyrimidine kinase n=1 Tax=Chelativorans sp. YIM 93263 TaxID=2906648 RepID=UPI002379FC92|nr:hydroxymethylpyrimidine/phosphomethylpyrimidine kinase [Chelativorans sp. YIM 93263]